MANDTDAARPEIATIGNLDIAFYDVGPRDGRPTLLVHGFASNAQLNWFATSWVTTLVDAGRRVVALDNRGHGHSTKFYDPTDYGPDIFAKDAVGLLDHLEIEKADVIGFSMGARIAFALAHWHPERVHRVSICGMGANIFGGRGNYQAVAASLEAETLSEVTDPAGRSFRIFAERTGSDLKALAACIRPSEIVLTSEMAGNIRAPVLVAVGGDDEIAGAAEPLAELIEGAESFTIPDRDHMRSTGDKAMKRAVMDFIDR